MSEPQPLDDLRRDGFSILRGAIPPDAVGAVRDSVAETIRRHTTLPLPQGYVTGFLRRDQSIAPYITEPRLLAIVQTLFGNYARISSLTGVINGPGIARGAVHADWPYNQQHQSRIQAPYPDLIVNLTTMWMLTDFTVENGGTIIIPGSQRRHTCPPGDDLDPMAVYEGEIQLQGRAGDVGLFDARTWHAIAPNVSGEERIAVIVRFAPWWLNLGPLRPGTQDRRFIVDRNNGTDSQVEFLPRAIHDRLPAALQPYLYSMVEE